MTALFKSLGQDAPAAAPTAAAPAKNDRPQAQVWLNVGVTVPMPNDEGVVEDVFVSIPVGIALDTMEDLEMKGSNKNWANMVSAKNWLLGQLKEAASGVAVGETQIIDELQVQLRRVGTPVAVTEGENPILSAMSGVFGAKS